MSTYVELTTETAHLIIDEVVSVNKRGLGYVKSVWGIVAKPLPTSGTEAVNKGFERADALISLTLSELETSITEGAEFAEKLIAQGTKIQEAALASLKDYAEKGYETIKDAAEKSYDQVKDVATKGLDNAKSIAEATSEQIAALSKRVESATEELAA